MLAELAIDDLVLIAEARLALSPGLNVITGETGAGKSLLAQAIGLLLGDRADESLVRRGASRALVQAVFESGGGSRAAKGAHAAPELAVSRQVPREGRSRVYVDGLVSSAAIVEAALRDRVAFYGQLEHAKLLQLDRQLDLLDAAAPETIGPLLASYGEAYATVSSTCCASRSASSRRRRSNRARTSTWHRNESACATPRSCSSACRAPCACCRPATRAAPPTVCAWPSVW